ncbi:hypothetical protein ACIQPR_46715 [Streptomyces sp. NPDC091280]|uniref:hypothetical protein n=1 Tax=unclassified Streptomyces TaxID=2593676 RepID=UPI0037F82CA6
MTQSTESLQQPSEESPEVEAHSILDLQSLGKSHDRSGFWTCLSNISSANEE